MPSSEAKTSQLPWHLVTQMCWWDLVRLYWKMPFSCVHSFWKTEVYLVMLVVLSAILLRGHVLPFRFQTPLTLVLMRAWLFALFFILPLFFFYFLLLTLLAFVFFPHHLSSVHCSLSLSLSGIIVTHYLQSITPSLALGGEMVYHRRPGEEGTVVSLVGRYTGEGFCLCVDILMSVEMSTQFVCVCFLCLSLNWELLATECIHSPNPAYTWRSLGSSAYKWPWLVDLVLFAPSPRQQLYCHIDTRGRWSACILLSQG